jgi:hypothetical protein
MRRPVFSAHRSHRRSSHTTPARQPSLPPTYHEYNCAFLQYFISNCPYQYNYLFVASAVHMDPARHVLIPSQEDEASRTPLQPRSGFLGAHGYDVLAVLGTQCSTRPAHETRPRQVLPTRPTKQVGPPDPLTYSRGHMRVNQR